MTEQYPDGLGRTVPELATEGATVLPKMHFSCMEEPSFAEHFRALGRKQAVIATNPELGGAEVTIVGFLIPAGTSGIGKSIGYLVPEVRHNRW